MERTMQLRCPFLTFYVAFGFLTIAEIPSLARSSLSNIRSDDFFVSFFEGKKEN